MSGALTVVIDMAPMIVSDMDSHYMYDQGSQGSYGHYERQGYRPDTPGYDHRVY